MSATGTARAQNKPLLVYFWAEGSEQCERLYRESMSQEAVVAELDHFVCFSANTRAGGISQLVERFGIDMIPSMIVLNPEGHPEDAILGYIPPGPLQHELERIRHGEGTISRIRAQLAEQGERPEDLEANLSLRRMLVDKLDYVGEEDAARATRLSILAMDPRGETVIGAREHMEHTIEEIAEKAGSDDLAAWDLKPLYRYLGKVKHDQIRYEGWTRLGNFQAAARRPWETCEAFMEAWNYVPELEVLDWSYDVSSYLLHVEEEDDHGEEHGEHDGQGEADGGVLVVAVEPLSKSQRRKLDRFGLELAEASVKIACLLYTSPSPRDS